MSTPRDHMDLMRELYGQPRDAYQGTRPPTEAKPQQHARLLSCRPAGDVVVVTMETADGVLQTVRATTADSPPLAVLSDTDRSTIRSALLTLARGAPRDAA